MQDLNCKPHYNQTSKSYITRVETSEKIQGWLHVALSFPVQFSPASSLCKQTITGWKCQCHMEATLYFLWLCYSRDVAFRCLDGIESFRSATTSKTCQPAEIPWPPIYDGRSVNWILDMDMLAACWPAVWVDPTSSQGEQQYGKSF